MTFEEKKALIDEQHEEIVLFDGYEEALVGIARHFNNEFAVYDREKCIEILMKRDEMTREDAEEFFEFNSQGCWAGEHTPAFITFFEGEGKPAEGHEPDEKRKAD